MIFTISGGRADGRAWPDAGGELVLDDGEAADLVRGGMAMWDEPPGWQPAPPVLPAAPPEAMVSEPAKTAAGPVATEPVPEPPAEPERTEAPASYAPKAAWVEWAMKHGASEDAANMATKAQLMEAYGDRP